MTTINIRILKANVEAAPGKLADAEIHFNGGEPDGLRLVGTAVWGRTERAKSKTSASCRPGRSAWLAAELFACCGEWHSTRCRRDSNAQPLEPTPPGDRAMATCSCKGRPVGALLPKA
jgi:hypothetical protein